MSPTPIPFLFAVVFGDLGFDTNFDGHDMRGIREWLDSDHNNTGLLLNGIYLADSHANGVDAELSAYARIGVGAEFNIAVASAGVEGGLRGVLGSDLRRHFDHDGKIHYDEFLANASRGLEYTFDLRVCSSFTWRPTSSSALRGFQSQNSTGVLRKSRY